MAPPADDLVLQCRITFHKDTRETADTDHEIPVIVRRVLRFDKRLHVGHVALIHLATRGEESLENGLHRRWLGVFGVEIPHTGRAANARWRALARKRSVRVPVSNSTSVLMLVPPSWLLSSCLDYDIIRVFHPNL